jgi:hypothetical protein
MGIKPLYGLPVAVQGILVGDSQRKIAALNNPGGCR